MRAACQLAVLAAALFFVIAAASRADPTQAPSPNGSDWRCSWTDCENNTGNKSRPAATQSNTSSWAISSKSESPLPVHSASPLASNSSAVAKECTAEDIESCANSCRSTFDKDFFKCQDDCLKTKCTVEQPGAAADQEQHEMLCIEDESGPCEEKCVSENGTRGSRCRLECLQMRCPKAPSGVRGREAANPGTLKCNRCKNEHQRDCRDLCAIGAAPLAGDGLAGIGALGCLKLCLQTSCGDSCANASLF